MAIIFLITQLFIAAFAWFKGLSDAAWSFPFRKELTSPEVSQSMMDAENKKAHRYGFMSRAFPIIAIGLLMSCLLVRGTSLQGAIIAFGATVLYGTWFWLVFDISAALGIKEKWWYTGTTAGVDKEVAGRGKIKACLCCAVIIVINILAFIFVI